jgi:putative dimethyl sulfoxide reductase chaperone
MPYQENVDWHMARSHVYGLLGSLLSEQPGEKTIDQLLRPEAVDYLETMFADPQIGSRFHQLAAQYCTGKISTEQVALDFEGLMRVPGETYTHPYESVYRARREGEESLKWGGLYGSQARDAERYYHSEGLEPCYDRVDFADHIGAELTFMAHMCRKTAEALQIEQVDISEHLQAKQQEFAQNHLLAWAEDFSAELKLKAVTPFFQAVADMLVAFVELEKSQLKTH